MKVIELFGGIGAARKALINKNITHEIVDYVEIDKNAVEVYNSLYNDDYKPMSIIDWNKNIDIDFVIHGSPCQDFSTAGKQLGGVKGSGTRSSLIYETIRIINKTKPKFVLWENVKNSIQGKHLKVAKDYFDTLELMGYKNYYKIINSKYFNIPQSRERVIAVSILNNKGFSFPDEDIVANNLQDFLDFREKDDLTSNFYERYKLIKNKDATFEEFLNYIENLPTNNGIGTKKMGLYNFNEMDTITTIQGLTGTLTCRNVQNYNKKYWYNNRLYKPSPKMTWKLMGFSDDDFEKVKHFTDKVLYDRAGNSIVVNVLEAVFEKMIEYGYLNTNNKEE